MNLKGAFFALLAFAVFATHDVVIKVLGVSFSPFQMVFFSTLFSFPLITLMLMRDKTSGHLRPVHPWWTLFRTLASTVNALGAFYAFSNLPLAQVYALIFAAPLVITVLSIPILGERVGFHRWAAVILGLIGVIIVLRPTDADLGLGHLAALSCAFFGGFAAVVVRKIGQKERTVVLMLYPLVSNFIVMGALMVWTYQPMSLPEMGGVSAIAVLGFLGGIFLILAYKAAEAAIVAPMQYSQIIWATLFGYLFFNERPDLPTIIGTAIIIASGLYIVFRESQGGTSENTPVLRTRTRAASATSFRISTVLRRAKTRQ